MLSRKLLQGSGTVGYVGFDYARSNVAVASVTVDIGSIGVQSGDLAIAMVWCENAVATPSGWTLRTSESFQPDHAVFTKTLVGTETTQAFGTGGANDEMYATVVVLRGYGYSSASSGTEIAGGFVAASPSAGSVSSTDIIVLGIGVKTGSLIDAPSEATLIDNENNGGTGDLSVASAYATEQTGTYNPTAWVPSVSLGQCTMCTVVCTLS